MEYNIEALKGRLEFLGGEISDSGYVLPGDNDGPNMYDYELKNLKDSYLKKLEDFRKSCTSQDEFSKGYKFLNDEYQKKKEIINGEMNKHYANNGVYAEAALIVDVLRALENMKRAGIEIDKTISRKQLETLLLQSGGMVESNSGNKTYSTESKPEKIKNIEDSIANLGNEVGQLGVDRSVVVKKVEAIRALNKELQNEMNNNPQYAMQRLLVETLNAVEKLESFRVSTSVM